MIFIFLGECTNTLLCDHDQTSVGLATQKKYLVLVTSVGESYF